MDELWREHEALAKSGTICRFVLHRRGRRIKEFRKLRNLLAHFAIKRFPTEDALVFVTKDASDYKKVLGAEPDPGLVMAAVAELSQVRDVCRMIEGIQHWLSSATNDIENAFLKSKSGST